MYCFSVHNSNKALTSQLMVTTR